MKCSGYSSVAPLVSSPPSRGAWIEIYLDSSALQAPKVAPLAGGVD